MKETFWRAGRTFLQSAVGYAVVAIPTVITADMEFGAMKTALFGLLISAVSAGLAAVMNLPGKEA
ncbi:MAG: hypothetical protein IJ389_02210 [Clostridia bacterium]|nr:hypothetical protein [Clostridia bacterium]